MPSLDDWEKEWKKNPQGMPQPKVVPVDFQSKQAGPGNAVSPIPATPLAQAI